MCHVRGLRFVCEAEQRLYLRFTLAKRKLFQDSIYTSFSDGYCKVHLKWAIIFVSGFGGLEILSTFALQTQNGGAIAQLVEQRTENPCVPGSIPGGTTAKRGFYQNDKNLFLYFQPFRICSSHFYSAHYWQCMDLCIHLTRKSNQKD